MEPGFEWNDEKAASNFRKHGVSFDEGTAALNDPRVLVNYDLEHSLREDRRSATGFSERGRLLTVTYTMRGSIVRLISVRRANEQEKRAYGERKT